MVLGRKLLGGSNLPLEQGEFYRKYGDKRFERFWRYLGLDLSLQKASEIYNRLLKKDFGGKNSPTSSSAPNVALLSAIQRMENYAMVQRQPYLNQVVTKLWILAKRSAYEEQYTDDSLRINLMDLYSNYRTIRENACFESLDEFAEKVAGRL